MTSQQTRGVAQADDGPRGVLHAGPSDAQLAPCPFCGGAPFLDNLSRSGTDRYSWYVRCTICEVQQIVNNDSRAVAVAGWNRRAADPLRAELMDMLKHMLGAIDGNGIDSEQIDGDYESGIPPHKWHEEWATYARALIAKAESLSPRHPDREAGGTS